MINMEVGNENVIQFIECETTGDIVRYRTLTISNMKLSPLPSRTNIDVFI